MQKTGPGQTDFFRIKKSFSRSLSTFTFFWIFLSDFENRKKPAKPVLTKWKKTWVVSMNGFEKSPSWIKVQSFWMRLQRASIEMDSNLMFHYFFGCTFSSFLFFVFPLKKLLKCCQSAIFFLRRFFCRALFVLCFFSLFFIIFFLHNL